MRMWTRSVAVGVRGVVGAGIAVSIGIAAAGCRSYTEPEAALRGYAGAVRERRCGDSLEYLSSRTRRALNVLREKPQDRHSPLPLEEYYCNKFAFEDCKLDELTLGPIEGDAATVAMSCGRTQSGLVPGLPSMFLKYEPRDFELVREDGRWRVALPHVIKIVEVREREDELRERVLREQREHRERRIKKVPR